MEPVATKVINGVIICLWRYLFNWRLQIAPENDQEFITDEWCFSDEDSGIVAVTTWDGIGDPPGWLKHPATNRLNPEHPIIQSRAYEAELK